MLDTLIFSGFICAIVWTYTKITKKYIPKKYYLLSLIPGLIIALVLKIIFIS